MDSPKTPQPPENEVQLDLSAFRGHLLTIVSNYIDQLNAARSKRYILQVTQDEVNTLEAILRSHQNQDQSRYAIRKETQEQLGMELDTYYAIEELSRSGVRGVNAYTALRDGLA